VSIATMAAVAAAVTASASLDNQATSRLDIPVSVNLRARLIT
jgi:hypothetical protein